MMMIILPQSGFYLKMKTKTKKKIEYGTADILLQQPDCKIIFDSHYCLGGCRNARWHTDRSSAGFSGFELRY